ncbi:PDDEXK nuclease domain-containing protein [Hoylesella loescheii]|jgi:hypothetical protein|uniref:PDDEXK nuclease domain-containing protein n=1 Tax=Hoylesella loescheii TaxID=840 RepID=UPI0028E9263C|nr:PDDEXK nuclease domain-containing protein [Hoylesella loescheii]
MKQDNEPMRKDFRPIVQAIGSDLMQTQVRIASAANADMLFHYWKVGTYILYLQEREGWGSKVIERLSQVIRSEYPDKKGYSARNLVYMCQFAKAYSTEAFRALISVEKRLKQPSVELVRQVTGELNEITQEPLAQLQNIDSKGNTIVQEPLAQIQSIAETLLNALQIDLIEIETAFKQSAVVRTNWASHVILLNSRLPLGERYWYITQAVSNGWSSNVLKTQLDSNLFARQIAAKKVNNFAERLPQPQSDLANYLMKDPYIFDLMGQTERMTERDIERQLVSHVTKYLLDMGNGFAFVAQQKHFQVGNQDFYADLVLYNIPLHAYVVVELKASAFKPEYMGQLNFYANVIDNTLRGEHDNKTIGLLLCNGGDKVVAQYALSGYEQPIGVSDYQLSKAIPENLKAALPSIEEVEEELTKLIEK